jgi:hypothetical protein
MRNFAALAQRHRQQSDERRGIRQDIRAAAKEINVTGVRERAAIVGLEHTIMRQAGNVPGFFPTPAPLAAEVLTYARPRPGLKWLDPEAGKGNLVLPVRALYPDADITCIEINPMLCEVLRQKGFKTIHQDVLTYHEGGYDRIIMNPAFERLHDADVVRHCYGLLADDGILVSITSPAPYFRSDRKAAEFREWLKPLDHELHDLPEGAFKSSERPTGVRTKLLVIYK